MSGPGHRISAPETCFCNDTEAGSAPEVLAIDVYPVDFYPVDL